jgi:hypothetical protein
MYDDIKMGIKGVNLNKMKGGIAVVELGKRNGPGKRMLHAV